ncbi:MAG: DNA N-6-adenine-methyltransferase [Methylococcaceae bacterium]
MTLSVVRPLVGGYELIVGERRLRAVETFAKKILARVLPLTDLEARRWVATENMQRENLSSIEEVDSIVEMLDAELFDFLDYAGFADNSKLRVKYLLGKLNSDRRNETDFFTHKFVGKVESIFSALPTRKDWRSFYVHDLPLLNIASEVLAVSVANKLNASQTRALNNLNKTAPEKFKELVAKTDENGVVLLGKDDAGEALTLQNTSASEIKNTVAKADLACFRSSDSNEWYTPEKYMEAVSKFFGGIDLDPCSCEKANKTVKAKSIFTIADDSLTKEWAGKVFLNPPYGKDDS